MLPDKNIVITIDGPTGAGKSTVGKKLAEEIGFIYLDTGAMYRVAAFEAKKMGINPAEEDLLGELCSNLQISFKQQNGLRVFSDGRDVTDEIRTPEMSMLASRVSAIKSVRETLVRLQREIGNNGGVVVDGRDAGTVIFPRARVKFFLDATLQTRSQRRYKELIAKKIKVDYTETLHDVEKRDREDSSRDISPLKPAPDAIIIDSSEMTIGEVVGQMLKFIRPAASSLP